MGRRRLRFHAMLTSFFVRSFQGRTAMARADFCSRARRCSGWEATFSEIVEFSAMASREALSTTTCASRKAVLRSFRIALRAPCMALWRSLCCPSKRIASCVWFFGCRGSTPRCFQPLSTVYWTLRKPSAGAVSGKKSLEFDQRRLPFSPEILSLAFFLCPFELGVSRAKGPF